MAVQSVETTPTNSAALVSTVHAEVMFARLSPIVIVFAESSPIWTDLRGAHVPTGACPSVPAAHGWTTIQVRPMVSTSPSENGGGKTAVSSAQAESIRGEPFSIALSR